MSIIADVDQPVAIRAAVRVGVVDGARRDRGAIDRQRAGNEAGRAVVGAEIVDDLDIVERPVGSLYAQRVAQHIAGIGDERRVIAAIQVLDGLFEEVAVEVDGYGVKINMVNDTWVTIATYQTAIYNSIGIARFAIEPKECSSTICELSTILTVSIQSSSIVNDQALTGPNGPFRRNHMHFKSAGRLAVIQECIVDIPDERALSRNGCDTIGLKYLST